MTNAEKVRERWINTVSPEIHDLLKELENAGGVPYVVGGFVRDAILGVPSKDIDVELFGIDEEQLGLLIDGHCEWSLTGKFKVHNCVTPDGSRVEIALPRTEVKNSDGGHTGFDVTIDENIGLDKAHLRRDLTINCLYFNTINFNIVDPSGRGLDDLDSRTLSAVSEKFGEDPLRVLRVFGFISRYEGMNVDEYTLALCKNLSSEFETLSVERVWDEWEKWAIKSVKPSKGLEFLRSADWIKHFPEVDALIGVEQDSEWHPEGDVWNHSLIATDRITDTCIAKDIAGNERIIRVFAALCHDFGKPACTVIDDGGRIRSPKHDTAGVEPTENFFASMSAPLWVAEAVKPLVDNHMFSTQGKAVSKRAFSRLKRRLGKADVFQLVDLMDADVSARPPLPITQNVTSRVILERIEKFPNEAEVEKPLVGGADLMELAKFGVIPEKFLTGGVHFGNVLGKVQAVQDSVDNFTRVAAIGQAVRFALESSEDEI